MEWKTTPLLMIALVSLWPAYAQWLRSGAGNHAFAGRFVITSEKITNSVKIIDECAFSEHIDLTQVQQPKGSPKLRIEPVPIVWGLPTSRYQKAYS